MKSIIILALSLSAFASVNALVINEVMSNPVGDDGGREWIELYNNSAEDVDLSSLMVSVKGGSFVVATPVSGGFIIPAFGYAIIGSTVSGVTKFMMDYPLYSKPLFKSSISLVNTGVTSLDIKVQGSVLNTVSSYTAAKEGHTYSRSSDSFASGEPTPGEENKLAVTEVEATTTETSPQVTIPQMSAPSADIVLYLPQEKIVVAGAPSVFSVTGLTHAGKVIDSMTYTWSFGDGGEKTGSTTLYRYAYPGRYVAQVEGSNGFVAGTGRMIVRVVSPELVMSVIGNGKYGNYIDLTNNNIYDLDISGWKISIDGALFSFPKNTVLSSGVTRFSGVAMGFASTTVSSSTLIKLLFPSMDEVLRVSQSMPVHEIAKTSVTKAYTATVGSLIAPSSQRTSPQVLYKKITPTQSIPQGSTASKIVVQASTTKATITKVASSTSKKDTRIASFVRSFFR